MSDELVDFVRRGLASGHSRAELEQALLKAGWVREQVVAALASFADIDFPIPVPRPRPYVSARDAFMYLVMFITLYISAYNLGSILFQFIDRAFPDPAASEYARWTADAIRWSASSLIVAFPVFLYMSWTIGRSIKADATKRGSRVRKQLTYVTLLLGACVLLGDVTALVYNLLGGELTVRFLLKVATIALIAGTIFIYYLRDLRLDERGSEQWTVPGRYLAGLAAMIVLEVVVVGLRITGSPEAARHRQTDQRRLEHLREIAAAANLYWTRRQELPATLDHLIASGQGALPEPETRVRAEPYDYRVVDSRRFELCARFEQPSEPGGSGDFWQHQAGRQCFQFSAKAVQP